MSVAPPTSKKSIVNTIVKTYLRISFTSESTEMKFETSLIFIGNKEDVNNRKLVGSI